LHWQFIPQSPATTETSISPFSFTLICWTSATENPLIARLHPVRQQLSSRHFYTSRPLKVAICASSTTLDGGDIVCCGRWQCLEEDTYSIGLFAR
jgi:hypothetical protein